MAIRKSLTRREREILQLMVNGEAARRRMPIWQVAQQLAATLDVEAHTVDQHIRSICHKLEVPNTREAVYRGVLLGLIEANTEDGAEAYATA